MIKQLSFAEQCMVRMVCALALLFVGLAHTPPVAIAADHVSPAGEMARYTLPDGSIPVLCLPSTDGKAKQQHNEPGSGCEACRLSASLLLPAPPDASVQTTLRQPLGFLPGREEAFYRQLFPPNAAPRGPPSGLVS